NGSRYQLIMGYDDWKLCRVDDDDLVNRWAQQPSTAPVEYDTTVGALRLRRLPFEFPPAENDRIPDSTQRRGAAIDRFGNVYWIGDDSQTVLVGSHGDGTTRVFTDSRAVRATISHGSFEDCAPGLTAATTLSGATVTSDHELVVGTVVPAG